MARPRWLRDWGYTDPDSNDALGKRARKDYARIPGRTTDHVDEDRECLGWPEVGDCSNEARPGSRYCDDCNEGRSAHGDEDDC